METRPAFYPFGSVPLYEFNVVCNYICIATTEIDSVT